MPTGFAFASERRLDHASSSGSQTAAYARRAFGMNRSRRADRHGGRVAIARWRRRSLGVRRLTSSRASRPTPPPGSARGPHPRAASGSSSCCKRRPVLLRDAAPECVVPVSSLTLGPPPKRMVTRHTSQHRCLRAAASPSQPVQPQNIGVSASASPRPSCARSRRASCRSAMPSCLLWTHPHGALPTRVSPMETSRAKQFR